jgi:ABC-2 type transport system permease protein
MNALWVVIHNEITQLLRDTWYFLLMTVGAIGTLLILAYTLSTDVEAIKTLVVDMNRTVDSRQFIQTLRNEPFFEVVQVDDRAAAELEIQAGHAKIAVIIPPDYSRRIQRRETVQIQAIIDGAEPGIATTATMYLNGISGQMAQMAARQIQGSGEAAQWGVDLKSRIEFNPRARTIVSVFPGLIAIVLSVTAVGAAGALAREKERGNFEMLICTPLGRLPLLLGRVIPYVVIGLLDIALFIWIGMAAFNIPLKGNAGLFLIAGILYIFATAGAGVLIAQFLQTQYSAAIVTFMLFGIAPTYLSDIFFPTLPMPVWLQWQSLAMPATHFNFITRQIFLKGSGWESIWPSVVTLLVIGLLMSTLAYLCFEKRLK